MMDIMNYDVAFELKANGFPQRFDDMCDRWYTDPETGKQKHEPIQSIWPHRPSEPQRGWRELTARIPEPGEEYEAYLSPRGVTA